MKYFDRDGKYNWVDENNVVVGFDSSLDCCECFGFYYTEEPGQSDEKELSKVDLDKFNFDPSYFRESDEDGRDQGGIASFKLVSKDQVIYLNLFNYHNGYYSHGFYLEKKGKTLQAGYL